MTVIVMEEAVAPDEVRSDAQTIVDETNADTVTIEDAVDDRWFIRIDGPVQGEDKLESLAQTVESVIGDTYEAFSYHYEVGPNDNEYLIRIEY